jgi:hypothetical protein
LLPVFRRFPTELFRELPMNRSTSLLLPFVAFLLLAVASVSAATPARPVGDTTGVETFGGKITLDPESSVGVGAAIDSSALHGTTILVRGRIADVCQNKGCWLVVADGGRQMRVTFKDYAFFVPKGSAGREVLLEGVVTASEISEEDARHYASESADPAVRAEDIHGPQKVVTMEAAAVAIAPRR